MAAQPAAPAVAAPAVALVFSECSNCRQGVLNLNLALHEAHCFRMFERCERCSAKVARGAVEAHRGDGSCHEAVSEAASAAVSKAGGHIRRLQSLRQMANTDPSR